MYPVSMSRLLIKAAPLPRSTIIVIQPVRWKSFGRAVIPHRKPRWIPMARSKMFKNPPVCLIEQEELDHMAELQEQYDRRLRALSQYLDEDYLKNSEVGEAAVIEAQKEEEEHLRLLKLNEEENARVAALRNQRLQAEREERKMKIARDLEAFRDEEEARLGRANQRVAKETEAMSTRILPENLEQAISWALDHPVDYEYAIDTQGHIFRGRSTQSLKTDPTQWEKMPPAPIDDKPILLEKSSSINKS